VVGESVDVLYDPQDPRRAHIAGKPLRRAWLYAVSITAAVFVLLAVVAGW
jgi:hypothetical protein